MNAGDKQKIQYFRVFGEKTGHIKYRVNEKI
jgi:hypothetical protein